MSDDGTSMYRGQRLSLRQLGNQPLPAQPLPTNRSRVAAEPKGERLKVLSMSLGGVCTSTYDILMNWVQDNKALYDVLLFPETQYGLGRQLGECSVPGWHVVPSPDPKHGWAGLAICISTRVCAATDVQFQEIMPGRILHARVHRQEKLVDRISYARRLGAGGARSRDTPWAGLFLCGQVMRQQTHINEAIV